jgi:hypothetical protein
VPVALGLVALLIAVAAGVFWSRPKPAPAVDATAPAVSVAAPALAPTTAPSAAAATVAAPAVASIVVPVAVLPAATPNGQAPKTRLEPAVRVPASAPLPVAEAPKPVRALALPQLPAAEAPKTVAVGPEAQCAGLNPFKYFVCMESACLRAEFVAHADCQKWRKEARRE